MNRFAPERSTLYQGPELQSTCKRVSTFTHVNRGSTFALRRSTLGIYLGEKSRNTGNQNKWACAARRPWPPNPNVNLTTFDANFLKSTSLFSMSRRVCGRVSEERRLLNGGKAGLSQYHVPCVADSIWEYHFAEPSTCFPWCTLQTRQCLVSNESRQSDSTQSYSSSALSIHISLSLFISLSLSRSLSL